MLVIFYTNLVKVETVWLIEKRELHSCVDGGSIIRSTEGRDDRSNIGKATDDRWERLGYERPPGWGAQQDLFDGENMSLSILIMKVWLVDWKTNWNITPIQSNTKICNIRFVHKYIKWHYFSSFSKERNSILFVRVVLPPS